eukprot:Rmarinus@m.8350
MFVYEDETVLKRFGALPFDGEGSRKPTQKGLDYKGWKFLMEWGPILTTTEVACYEEDVGIPMPEMVFGANSVSLTHSSGTKIDFCSKDALLTVEKKSIIKLPISDLWKNRTVVGGLSQTNMDFDWTYTSNYLGKYHTPTGVSFAPTPDAVDTALLMRPDPVLMFGDVLLYESEMADHGVSTLSVKFRVMPSCFLVLLRNFVRVDKVLVRVSDTRLYHNFDHVSVIREAVTREVRNEDLDKYGFTWEQHFNGSDVSHETFHRMPVTSSQTLALPLTLS